MRKAKRILLVGLSSDYDRQALRSAHTYGRLHGRWETHIETNENPESMGKIKVAIREWKADGIIAYVRTSRFEKLIRNCGIATVNMSGANNLSIPTVTSNSAAAGQITARHFLGSGFRNFAFCASTPEVYVQKMLQGFSQELRGAGLSCDVFTDYYTGKTESDWFKNRKRMDRWLLSLKKPVAMMCIYDLRALQVATACQRLGIRIPESVAVVGVGNEEFICQMSTPPLSGVDPDLQRIGYEAAALLDRILNGDKPPPSPILIPPRQLVTRQSSDIVTLDDPEIAAAVRFIRGHAHEPISVKNLLREVPISRRAMELRFRKLIGRSPLAEITRVRMERARNLLADTHFPIPVVASKSGFTNSVIFSASFRREMDMTPTQYRRSRSPQTGVPQSEER